MGAYMSRKLAAALGDSALSPLSTRNERYPSFSDAVMGAGDEPRERLSTAPSGRSAPKRHQSGQAQGRRGVGTNQGSDRSAKPEGYKADLREPTVVAVSLRKMDLGASCPALPERTLSKEDDCVFKTRSKFSHIKTGDPDTEFLQSPYSPPGAVKPMAFPPPQEKEPPPGRGAKCDGETRTPDFGPEARAKGSPVRSKEQSYLNEELVQVIDKWPVHRLFARLGASVTHLDLKRCRLDNAGGAAIADALMARLTSRGPRGRRGLDTVSLEPSLTSLDLRDCVEDWYLPARPFGIQGAGVAAIARAVQALGPRSTLTDLNLSYQWVRCEGGRALAAMLRSPACVLARLSLKRAELGGDAMTDLLRSAGDSHALCVLDVSWNAMDADAFDALANTLERTRSLRSLSATHVLSPLGSRHHVPRHADDLRACAAHLARGLAGNATLTALDVRGSFKHNSSMRKEHGLDDDLGVSLIGYAAARHASLTHLAVEPSAHNRAGRAALAHAAAVRGFAWPTGDEVDSVSWPVAAGPKNLLPALPAAMGAAQDVPENPLDFAAAADAVVGEVMTAALSGRYAPRQWAGPDARGTSAGADRIEITSSLSGPLVDALVRGLEQARADAPALQRVAITDAALLKSSAVRICEALRSDAHRGLHSLDLSKNPIRARGAWAVSLLLRGHPALKRVKLAECEIGDRGAAAIAATLPDAPFLTFVDLSYNAIGKSGGAAIAEALRKNAGASKGPAPPPNTPPRSAREGLPVDAPDGPMGMSVGTGAGQQGTPEPEGGGGGAAGVSVPQVSLRTIVRTGRLPLRTLVLRGNGGTHARTAISIAMALDCNAVPSLTHLSLRECGIKPKGVRAIFDALSLPNASLVSLDLDCNPLGALGADTVVDALFRMPATGQLRKLGLSYCDIPGLGVSRIVNALRKTMLKLQAIRLGGNAVDNDAHANAALLMLLYNTPGLGFVDLRATPGLAKGSEVQRVTDALTAGYGPPGRDADARAREQEQVSRPELV